MKPTVVIVGRPNVGKSTLFNRLVGRRLAIVDDTPGVTRDRREGEGQLLDLEMRVIDTAGLEEAFDDSLEARMRRQTEQALEDADVALFLIDARSGVMPLDEHFAGFLRKQKTPIILCANKCEGRAGEPGLMEAYGLGLGEPVPLSAEHGEGLSDLYMALREKLSDMLEDEVEDEEFHPIDSELDTSNDEGEDEWVNRPVQLVVVGRPNVGKSTLINRLIGEERMLTGPEAGITRDSIAIDWAWKGRPIKLVDTAGIRRKARVEAKIEKLSVADTLRSVRYAHVVALVLDANDMLEKQDLTIARKVIEEGRALIIVVNKWDTIDDKAMALKKLEDRLQTSLPQVKGIPVVTVSALKGRNTNRILDAVFETFDIWNSRISTSALNRWLGERTEAHPPPLARGRRIKLRYMTQARSRPPTFVVFASVPEELPESYMRFLANGLRQDFGLIGVPIRINLRKGKNPYAPKK